jgi:hypothetical protein
MHAPQFDLRSITYTDDEGVERNAYDYLLKDGNLAVPGGRYGHDTKTCADIALMLFLVLVDGTGEDPVEALDGCMSAVVNSHDDVCWTILDAGHVFARNDDGSPLYFIGSGVLIPRDFFDDDEIAYSRELYEQAYDEPPYGW